MILLISCANCADLTRKHYQHLEEQFEKLSKNSKQFKNMTEAERQFRRAVFFENAALIQEYNEKHKSGAKLKVNKFALLTN